MSLVGGLCLLVGLSVGHRHFPSGPAPRSSRRLHHHKPGTRDQAGRQSQRGTGDVDNNASRAGRVEQKSQPITTFRPQAWVAPLCTPAERRDTAQFAIPLPGWAERPTSSPEKPCRNSNCDAVAGEIDAMGVVNEAVEDGIGINRVADKACHLSTGIWLVRMVKRRP